MGGAWYAREFRAGENDNPASRWANYVAVERRRAHLTFLVTNGVEKPSAPRSSPQGRRTTAAASLAHRREALTPRSRIIWRGGGARFRVSLIERCTIAPQEPHIISIIPSVSADPRFWRQTGAKLTDESLEQSLRRILGFPRALASPK
jgi:hypothetical protein